MSFGEKLRARREELGMKQAQLGKLLGVSGAAIGNYENSVSMPKAEVLIRIFRALDTDANFLFEDYLGKKSFDVLSIEERRLLEDYNKLDRHGKDLINTIMRSELTRLGEIREKEPRFIRHYLEPAAAGFANPVLGSEFELIEADSSVPYEADFCIDIRGDSMEPYIKDGERVYVQRDATVNEFSDVGVFYYNGEVLCKQFCLDIYGSLHLLSANPERESMNVEIGPHDAENLVCFGKVILKKKLPRPLYL